MSHEEKLDTFISRWNNLGPKTICPSVVFASTITQGPHLGMVGIDRAVAHHKDLKKESTSFYQTVDILSEGEVHGLCDAFGQSIFLSNDQNKNSDYFKGIYLNDTPVKNTKTNTYNYRTAFSEIRLGTEDQLHFSDLTQGLSFAKSSQTFNYNVQLFANVFDTALKNVTVKGQELKFLDGDNNRSGYPYDTVIPTIYKPDFIYSEFPFVHTVTNHNVDSVVINVAYTGRYQSSSGSAYSAGVTFVIEVGHVGDELSLGEGGSVGYVVCSIRGLASSEYIRSHHIPLPDSGGTKYRFVRVTRVDRDFGPAFVQGDKSLAINSIVENISEKLRYPNSTLIANIFDASAFGQIPKRSYDLKLLKINVPSNYDPESKIYSGNWNGTFAPNKQWSDNPAWILYDIITNNRYGLGKYAFQQAMLDKWNLYSIGKYCDELLPTGNTGLQPPIGFSTDSSSAIFSIPITSENTRTDLQSIFEVGSEICFLDLKNSSSEDVNLNYRAIIKKTRIDGLVFKFEIVRDFGVDKIFFDYPELKRAYLYQRGNSSQSAKKWLIDLLINKQAESYLSNSRSAIFYNYYYNSYSLNSSVTSGYIVRQYENERPILEPRFACNIVFTGQDEALNTINNIAAVFRGITYWNEGLVYPSIDKLKDPILMFNNSNVVGGSFGYTGSAKTSRTSSVVVRYNDADDNFKTKVAYAEDFAALRQFGYNEQEVVAIGTTSRSQAKRIADWILYTNQTETDVVQFSTGQEGSILLPGDIILIQDNFKSINRYGGRISNINFRDKSVTLDKGIKENIVGQKIYFMVPKSTTSSKDLSNLAKQRQNTNNKGITDSEIDNQTTPQIKYFTIASVSDGNVVTINETTDPDFNLITRGTIWSVENSNTGYDIKGIKYRVLSVEEKALNEFMITAMMYNATKFEALERNKNIEENQNSDELKFSLSDYPAKTVASDNFNTSSANIDDQIYDAYFVKEKSDDDIKLEVTFDFGTEDLSNIGGYVVDFFVLGKNLRFCLDGSDNRSFSVFLGNRSLFPEKGYGYKVYVYDKDFKLEQLNI